MKIKIVNILASAIILPLVSNAAVFDPLDNDLSIPTDIYETSPADVLRVELETVIRSGHCKIDSDGKKDYKGCTLKDVDNDIDSEDKFKPEIKVHFKADDFNDDGLESNATLRQRGGYSRFAEQKSYRIKLDSKKNLWRDQRKLQLNKHPWDITRVRNKLSFDLMKGIPHLPSLNSQFVELSIDNKDYGIYTHIENVGKEYLINRGWHKDSGIYKAKSFSFKERQDYDLDSEGKPKDEDAFESHIEIKRGKNHEKFVEMLAAVNNHSNNFQKDVLEKHFNRNNYLSWMAIHILTGNLDISHSNFYLYNPKGTDDFYFLPWDYDDTWGIDEQPDNVKDGTRWDKNQFNPQHLWSSNFHQRFLKQPNSLQLLTEAVTHIKNNYFSTQKVKTLLDRYQQVVSPLIKDDNKPDFYDLPSSTTENDTDSALREEYDLVYSQLLGRVQQNYDRFIAEKQSPMPFELNKPTFTAKNAKINFSWDKAFDPQNDPITYNLDVSSTPDFQQGTLKLSAKNIKTNAYTTFWAHPKGIYYYRVTAYDSANHFQNSNESYVKNKGKDNEIIYINSFDFKAPKGTGIAPFTPSNGRFNPALMFLLF